jgi:autotransporter translocation and assembly factor TamB
MRRSLLRHSLVRVLLLLAGLLLGLGFVLSEAVRLIEAPDGDAKLRYLALKLGRPAVPGLALGAINLRLTDGLTLEQIVLKDRFGGEAIRVARVAVRWDLSGLPGVVCVTLVEIVEPHVVARTLKSGKLNLAELVVPTPPEPEEPSEPSTLTVLLHRLSIKGAAFTMHQPGGGPPLRVDQTDLELALQMTPEELKVQLNKLATRARGVPGLPGAVRAALSGKVRLRGQRVASTLALKTTGLVPGDAPVGLDLKVGGTLGRLDLQLGLALPKEGRIDLKGQVAPPSAGVPLDYKVDLALARVQPQLLRAGLPPAVVSLHLTASGEGIPTQPRATASLSLRGRPGLEVQGIPVKRLRIDASTLGPAWTLSQLQLFAAGAKLNVDAKGDLSSFEGQVKLDAPRLAHTSSKLPIPVRLGGSLRLNASAKGPFAGPLAASCTATGRGLYLNAGSTRVGLETLDLDAAARGLPAAPVGRVHLTAQGIDPGVPAVGRVHRLALDLSGRQQKLALNLDLKGSLIDAKTKVVASLDPKAVSAQLQQLNLRYKQLTVAMQASARKSPTVDWRRAGGKVTWSPLRLRTLGGTLTTSGELRQTGTPRLKARLSLQRIRPPSKLLGIKQALPRVSGDLDAEIATRQLTAHGDLRLDSGATVAIDARLPVRLPRSGPAPQPRWRKPAELKLAIRELDLSLARAFMGPEAIPLAGRARLDVSLDGPLENPDIKVDLQLVDLKVKHLDALALGLKVRADERQISVKTDLLRAGHKLVRLDSSVDLGLKQLLRERAALARDPLAWLRSNRQAPVRVVLDAGPTELASLWELVPGLRGLRGKASERIEISGPLLSPQVKVSQRLEGGRHNERVLGDLTTTIDVALKPGVTEGKVRVTRGRDPLLKVDAVARFDLDTILTRKGLPAAAVQGRLLIPPLALARLKGLDPMLARARGTLQGAVNISGSTKAPSVDVKLQLRGARFDGATLGDLDLEGSLGDGRVDATIGLSGPRGGRLKGRVKTALDAPEKLQASLNARRLDLGVLAQLAPQIKESGGKLDLDLSLDARKGLDKADYRGSVRLKRGHFRIFGVPVLEQLELALALDPRQVRLSRLWIRSGDGELSAKAKVGLDKLMPSHLALDAQLEDFPAPMGSREPGSFSGKVRVRGGLSANKAARRLDVKVTITDGVLKVPKLGGGKDLHDTGAPPDVVFVDAQARKAAAEKAAKDGGAKTDKGPPLELAVAAHAGPLFVRGDELDLEVVTDVSALVKPGGGPRLTGKVEITRGRITVLGNKFKVRRARVLFSGHREPDPALDVELARRFDDVMVLIGVRGTAKSPELVLTSEPPIYDRSQIISLILTGRVDQRNTGDDESDKSVAIANAVTQMILGGTVRKIGKKVGLDVAKVNIGETKDKKTGEKSLRAEAEIGRYITERLYLGYRPIFGAAEEENAHEFLLEYRISLRWLLAAAFGDAGVGGLDLLWTYIY